MRQDEAGSDVLEQTDQDVAERNNHRTIAFLGGTGPLGRGLALRLGLAGHRILIGSRDVAKAAEAVDKVTAKTDQELDIRPVTNAQAAAEAETVFVTVPYAAQRPTLTDLAPNLSGKTVVSCVNALGFDKAGPYPELVADGSAAEEAAALLPDSQVVGAFQNVAAPSLLRVTDEVDADVLVVGDDPSAVDQIVSLAGQIPGVRPVVAGPLRLARPVEELTAVLIAVNKRNKTNASVRLTGL